MNPIRYALAELEAMQRMVAATDADACEAFVDEIQAAERVFVGGAGRSYLSMKMFAMRLMQTNHATYLVGEVCTPSVGPGDLLILASGSGSTPGTIELARKAGTNGARVAVMTMNPDGPLAAVADFVLAVPRTPPIDPANERPESAAMKKNQRGNFFETVAVLIADGIIARIMEREGLTDETIMRNHANLE